MKHLWCRNSAGEFLLLVTLLCSVCLSVTVKMGVADVTDSDNSGIASVRDIWQDFEGIVRITRMECGVDRNGESILSSISLSVSEDYFSEEGYERILLTWDAPYRRDLTPTVAYMRFAPDYSVTAYGNDFVGSRAISRIPTGINRETADVKFAYPNPLDLLLGTTYANLSGGLDWEQEERSINDRVRETIYAKSRKSVEGYVGTLKQTLSGTLFQVDHAKMLLHSAAKNDGVDTTDGRKVAFLLGRIPAALDMNFGVSTQHPDWSGAGKIILRTFEWQDSELAADVSGVSSSLLPKIIVLEEVFDRPRIPARSFHKRIFLFVQVEHENLQSFQIDWGRLLPNMRIADYVSESATVKSDVTKEDCEAWLFLKRASESSAEWRQFLETDLRSEYPDLLAPITIPEHVELQTEQPIEQYPLFDNPTVRLLPEFEKEQIENDSNPVLLNLMSSIREEAHRVRISTENTARVAMPHRRGYVPVTDVEQAKAKTTLRVILVLTSSCIAAIISIMAFLCFCRRQSENKLLKPIRTKTSPPRSANLSVIDSSKSESCRFSHNHDIISFLISPSVTVALVALSCYFLWTFPLKPLWAVVPLLLAVSLIAILPFASSKSGDTDKKNYFQYPGLSLLFSCTLSRILAVICFIIAPLFLVGIGVFDPVPCYSISLLACFVACVLFMLPNTKNSTAPQFSQVLAGIVFMLALLFASYIVLLCWQYVTARGLALPLAFANFLAYIERTVNMVPLISASFFIDVGDSCVFITRGNMPALISGQYTAKTFLLFDEHLHFLLLSLLLLGSFSVTMFLRQHGKFASYIFDTVSILFVLLVYSIVTWNDILGDQLDSVLWTHRLWGAISVAILWLSLRFLLESIVNDAKDNSSQNLTISFPKCLSLPSLLALVVFLLGSFWLLHDPGVVKKGRVLIDEYHSEWEKANLPMETDYYGVKTVYNYGFLKEILEKHFSSVATNDFPLTEQLLNDCDVLILKTPTKSYSQEEILVVHDFVKKGGGLWLIGDHTNIFGMNTYLNQIASKWNIRLNSDAVSPLPHYYQQMVHIDGLSPYAECGKRSHENLYSRKYLNHPIIGHNIPYVTVLTSCSVSAPLTAEHVSIVKGMYIDHAHYGSNTFFGNLSHDPDERYGHVLQNVALKDGYGRVAVWSDSTLFSNFSMCMTGVPQLAIGYVNWLNYSNYVPAELCRYSFLVFGLIILIIAFFLRQKPTQIVISICMGVLFVAVFVPVIDFINTASYSFDDYRKGFKTVGFDQEYSRTDLPNKDHIHSEDMDVFEGFYVFMQRLGLMPFSADKFSEAVQSDITVVINPQKQFDDKSVLEIQKEIVKNGKTLLLMAGERYQHEERVRVTDNANALLSRLGVDSRFVVRDAFIQTDMFGTIVAPKILVDMPSGAYINAAKEDEIWLSTAEGEALVVAGELGNGKIVLCSIPELYTNRTLGEPGVQPNHKQAVLFRSIISIFDRSIGLDSDKQDGRAAWEALLTPMHGLPSAESTDSLNNNN